MVPIGPCVGLTSVSEGFALAFENAKRNVTLLQPVSPFADPKRGVDQSEHPLAIETVKTLLSQGEEDRFLEFLIAYFSAHVKKAEVVIVEGISSPLLADLNHKIAEALSSDVVFVMSPKEQKISEQIEITAISYGDKVLGCFLTELGVSLDSHLYEKSLGSFLWDQNKVGPRVSDLQKHLHAKVISKGKMEETRVKHVTLAAETVEHVTQSLEEGMVVLTPGDRTDVIVAICKAYLGGVSLAALVLTSGYDLEARTHHLFKAAMDKGLTMLSVQTDSLRAALALQDFTHVVSEDDHKRRQNLKEAISKEVDPKWIQNLDLSQTEAFLSPPAFRYHLIEKAKAKQATIILPEGEEERILKAAVTCVSRCIAKFVILGKKSDVEEVAKKAGLSLTDKIQVIDPEEIREKYVKPFVELRKHKGATEEEAREALEDRVTLATMMLAEGEVDGLVAGATHTTAHTILPALKLIKTKPDVTLVSSVFFMCLKTQVLVYGDCAVNQNPTAEELADIAIQSAESAEQFGIPARIAMISYSTGSSGKGVDVETVDKATKLVKSKRPKLLVDGPLQYDAASTPEVAKKKAPQSPVAGQATVYVFPDLNTANTTYKAVQRSAHVLSIGPLLQGLQKPVNDLSRGATVEDIVFTIAMTAVQVEK